MGRLSKFESKMDKAFENAAGSMFKSPISPVQMTKRAEKEMHREKLVSAGVQHAPTLYNILVNPEDDEKLSGYYPTLAGEMETYLKGKADESDLHMDGHPLVRFIVDDIPHIVGDMIPVHTDGKGFLRQPEKWENVIWLFIQIGRAHV